MPKPLAQICQNHIYNEDCLKTMRRMPDTYIDLVVTSPPYDNMREYGGNFSFNFQKVARYLYSVMKEGGVIVWVVSDQTVRGSESGTSFKQALYFKEIGFNLFDTMIYLKPPRGAVGNNKTYWQTFEYMFVLSKGTPKTINLLMDRENQSARKGDRGTKRLPNGKLLRLNRGGFEATGRRTNVWEYCIGKNHSTKDDYAFDHPAMFPEKLAHDHIWSWSNEGDIVYDPFLGSGTTAKMSVLTGRKYVGSEINAEYCKIAKKRIRDANKQKSLLAA